MTHRPGWVSRAFARGLLALYPAHVRDEDGADMVADFLDTLASRRGLLDRMRFLSSAITDAVRSAAAERAGASTGAADQLHHRHDLMFGFFGDVRFGLRALRLRPGFVAAVVLTLALGIGANTAVFSLIDAVFLHPVGVREPASLVAIYQAVSSKDQNLPTSYPVYRALRDGTHTLSGLAAEGGPYSISVTGPDGPEAVSASPVSGNYFDVLGIRPFIGRLIGESDDGAHGASPFIVISYRTWQRWYDGDRSAIGKTVTIDGRPFTIIGVAPATFRGTDLSHMPDVWAPLSMTTSLGIGAFFTPKMDQVVFQNTALTWIEAVARIRPNETADAVAAELNQLFGRVPAPRMVFGANASQPKSPISVVPIARSAAIHDRDSLVRFVRLMFGVVVLTLVLGCANVANLLLVRSSERVQELGVRTALGASQTRIVRQLFIESAMLAIGGAVVGLCVALGTIRALSAFTLPGAIPLAQLGLTLDVRVLAFTACVAVGTALVFGLLPAIRAARLDLATFLRGDRSSRRGGGLRNTLVAVQVALALSLLVGATLFVRSLRAGLTTDLGFDPHPLAAVSLDLRMNGYDKPRMIEYYRAVESKLHAQPGIQDAAIATHIPLANGAPVFPFRAPDAATPDGAKNVSLIMNAVSASYFRTIRLPVLQGRDFTAAESEGNSKVAIVNAAAARRFWGNLDPIGRSLKMAMGPDPYTIVGVVKTTKYRSVTDDDVPAIFVPLFQEINLLGVNVVARSDAPAAALRTIQREVEAIDHNVLLRNPRLVGSQIDDALMPQRFGTRLFAIFSIIALVIAAVGVHGVVAYGVGLRRRELGIRIALGARREHIYWVVLSGSLAAVAFGGLAGIGIAVAGSSALAAFLYGVRPLDVTAFAAATMLLSVAAGFAAMLPARRAAHTDPMSTIRSE